ncbi:HD domain-containing protein [Patescibacteria group bacterium]|nr:MAG: HD domain-containing protein [Patescibacteria group bacterium]
MPSEKKAALARRRAEDRAALERGDHVAFDKEDMPRLPASVTRSLEEHAFVLVPAEDGAAQEAVREFFRRYGPALDDLEDCPAVNRLCGLFQLGIKRDPSQDAVLLQPGKAAARVKTAPFVHDRLTHSKQVAAHMVALGCTLGEPPDRLVDAALGSLLHDTGHCAFSHDGDQLLVARGRPDHEMRGQRLVLDDPDIRESLALAGARPDAVVAVMREQGRYGQMQKLMDTLAYVTLDAEMAGAPLPEGFGSAVLRSICGVDEHGFAVRHPLALMDVLTFRARLSKAIYYAWYNRVAVAMLQKVLGTLLDAGRLPLERLERGSDQEIEMRTTLALGSSGASEEAWLQSANAVSYGFWEEFERHWERLEFADGDAAAGWLSGLSPSRAASGVLCPPYDYTKKAFLARTSLAVEPRRLQASPDIMDSIDRQWIACAYKQG